MARATTSEIRAREHANFCHVLLIQGLDVCWTDNGSGDLLGSVVSGLTDRTMRAGLEVPHITMGVDPRKGRLETRPVTFKVVDHDNDHMAVLFGTVPDDDSIDILAAPVSPSTTTLTSITVERGASAVTTINPASKYIGLERIGSSGERNAFSPFNFSLPALYHAASQNDSPFEASVPVTDVPLIFEGRLVALYRFYEDEDETGVARFGAFSEADLAWWGVMRDRASITGNKVWAFSCYGPEGLLKRPLNATTQSYPANADQDSIGDSAWLSIRSGLDTDAAKREVGVLMWSYDRTTDSFTQYKSTWAHSDNTLANNLTPSAIAAAIGTVVSEVIDGTNSGINYATGGGNFEDVGGSGLSHAQFGLESLLLRVPYGTTGLYGIMTIILHEEVWAMLGWQPEAQNKVGPQTELTDARFYRMDSDEYDLGWVSASGRTIPPRSGYVVGEFTTIALGAERSNAISAILMRNKGKDRKYERVGGTSTSRLNMLEAKQWVTIGVDQPYMEAQTIGAPAPSETLPGVATVTDSTRYWVVRGRYLAAGSPEDEEPRVMHQVCRAAWADNGSGHMAVDGSPASALYIEEWLDPRAFGINERPLADRGVLAWQETAGGHEIAPLATLSQSDGNSPDPRALVWFQTLTSTGTASWSGSGQSATLTPGSNNVTIDSRYYSDREHASLGLGIPTSIIATAEDVIAAYSAADPRGDWKSPIQNVKIAFIGPRNSEDVLDTLTIPVGVGHSLHGGKYGLFPMFVQPSHEDVSLDPDGNAIEIGVADVQASPPPSHGRKLDGSYQRLILRYRFDPSTGETRSERTDHALDAAARYRPGNLEYEIVDWGLLSPGDWSGSSDMYGRTDAPPWTGIWHEMWAKNVPEFYAERNFVVSGLDVARPKGQHIWPGTLIRLTNEWPQNPYTGGYGLTNALARVLSVQRRNDGRAVCEVLVYGATLRNRGTFYAPCLRLAGYDSATRTARYVDQWRGGSLTIDESAGWTKPSWISGSGNMAVRLIRWDRVRWSSGPTGEVESVDTSAKTVTFASPGLTGTYLRDSDYVMVPDDYASQSGATWVQDIFGIICDVSKLGAGTQTGAKRYVG